MQPDNECIMNAPKNIGCNYMQPHACAGGHPNTLLKFSTFASESASCASESAGHHGPHGLEACLALRPLCWPPVAGVGKHMLGAVASMCGHCAMHLVAPCDPVLVCQHLMAATWAFPCHNWDFGVFLPSLGSRHANSVAGWPPRVGGPKNWMHLPCPQPKWAPKAQRGKAWHGCQNTIFL